MQVSLTYLIYHKYRQKSIIFYCILHILWYNVVSSEEWEKSRCLNLIGGYMSIEEKVLNVILKPINDLGIEVKEVKYEKELNDIIKNSYLMCNN